MAGPRSKGCALCKVRKIKCDQKWPTCTRCRRGGYTCPGPTPLVNYDRLTNCSQPPTAQSIHLGTPQAAPSILADRVAAQIVRLLNTASDRGIVIQSKYLKDLPKRLPQHASLRDSVSLFYTVWANYRRQRPAVEFINLPEYAKAVRSLRLALSSDQAHTIETLASATILHRTEELFNPSRHKVVHENGIASLVTTIGPPNVDDEFQRALLSEIYIILVPFSIATGWKTPLNGPNWSDSIVDSLSDCIRNKEGRLYMQSALRLCGDIVGIIPVLVQERQMFPTSISSVRWDQRKEDLKNELSRITMEMEKAISDLMGKLIQLGEITEEEDPISIAATSYIFPNVSLAQTLLSVQSLHLTISRMYYDWSLAHHLPDTGTQYQNFKKLCVHIWKYIKFLRNIEPFVAAGTPRGLYVTLEMADSEQRSYLLDLFAHMDQFLGRLSSDRQEMEREILLHARLLTGRRA